MEAHYSAAGSFLSSLICSLPLPPFFSFFFFSFFLLVPGYLTASSSQLKEKYLAAINDETDLMVGNLSPL